MIKKYMGLIKIVFEAFLMLGICISVWIGRDLQANYFLGLLVLFIVFDIRTYMVKKPEVDLRVDSDLLIGMLSSFLSKNSDYKLIKKVETPDDNKTI